MEEIKLSARYKKYKKFEDVNDIDPDFIEMILFKMKDVIGFSVRTVATVIEVIEHLDENRLAAFEKVLFKFARPQTAIVSTPNKEYNMHYSNLFEGDMRHRDHRFEWSRREFEMWAVKVAENYGYNVRFVQIGDVDNEFGSPTQMGVFSLI
ncbi:MAG: hypothetical protein ACOYWZ_11140 [Bacillota bacterium]